MKRVGILGGGQLGCMLAEAIHAHGGEVRFFDRDADSPALRRFAGGRSGVWGDAERLAAFAEGCDVLTFEMEHLDTTCLKQLKVPIIPSVSVLETTQDRGLEKRFLKGAGLPLVAYEEACGADDLFAKARATGFPFILKTRRGGYDGKGQWLVRGEEGLAIAGEALSKLAGDAFTCVLEDIVPLELEVSCVVARSHGKSAVFPVFENAHVHHVLDWTLVPARISPAVTARVQEIALAAAEALDLTGLLTTEFFVSRAPAPRSPIAPVDGLYVYVNEFAPRPHNSGHVTRKACTFSQFDALARILLDAPVGTPELREGAAYVMGNVLGDVYGDKTSLDLAPLGDHPGVLELVLYGKREPAARRKMGHFVVTAGDARLAIERASSFRGRLRGI